MFLICWCQEQHLLFLVTFSLSGTSVQVWYKCDEQNLKESKGLSRSTIHAGSGSFKKKQEAVRLKTLVYSGNTVDALHLILPLLMIEIIWQLVGIWQPARLSQISMKHPLQAGSSTKTFSLLETSMEEPARGQTAGPLAKRESSCEQVGAVLAVCAVPVLTQPSQPSSTLRNAQVRVHRQWQLRQSVEVSRSPDTNASVVWKSGMTVQCEVPEILMLSSSSFITV